LIDSSLQTQVRKDSLRRKGEGAVVSTFTRLDLTEGRAASGPARRKCKKLRNAGGEKKKAQTY